MHGYALFEQSIEKHASMRGLAAVEPEREFVQLRLQVSFFKGALMRSQQPTLSQSCNTVDAWQHLVELSYLDVPWWM